jgi:hypothetical protein
MAVSISEPEQRRITPMDKKRTISSVTAAGLRSTVASIRT